MIVFAISLIVFLVSLGALIKFVVDKFPAVSAIRLTDEKGEVAIRAKQAILEQRVRRNMASAWQRIRKRLVPMLGALRERWGRLKGWAEEVEHRYQENVERELRQSGGTTAYTPEAYCEEAERLAVAGDDAGAEKLAVKAVALDQKYIPAYKLLSRLYAARKEYNHVREVNEFLLRLDPHQADVYASLSTALIALGESDLALDAMEKAAMVEENNPKYLDQLLELAIMRKQKALARETLEKLREANPENEKLPVFETRINEMAPPPNPANGKSKN